MRTLFDYIRGLIIQKEPDRVVLEVQGLGFDIYCAATTSTQLPAPGEKAKIYTYFVVREDNMTLYGFNTLLERTVFVHLISVSGIGPRTALAVLSTFTAEYFVQIVCTNDEQSLCQVSGIGKKTAQRIMLELRDKIRRLEQQMDEPTQEYPDSNLTIAALRQLGYVDDEIRFALEETESSGSSSERVRAALEVLRKR